MDRPTVEDGYPSSGLVDGEWDAPDAALDLIGGAAVTGAHAWWEQTLHRVVGAWALDTTDDRGTVAFDRVAMGHAARARMLDARLPLLRELPTDRLVVEPGPASAALVAALDGLETGADGDRLAAWRTVAAALLDAHRWHLGRTDPVADTTLRRVLPAVIAGLADDIAAIDAAAADAAAADAAAADAAAADAAAAGVGVTDVGETGELAALVASTDRLTA